MTDATPDLILSDVHLPALQEAIYANFHDHSEAKGFPARFQPLTIQVRQDGVIVGGLIGRTGRGWLMVEYLALPMAEQGAGLGRQLMAMAEAEAVRRGCTGAFLNTIQFQAPGFYQKLGYREFGRLPGDPPDLDRIWFTKTLA